jgi:hypothetical protein
MHQKDDLLCSKRRGAVLRGLGVEHRVVEQGLPHYVGVGHVFAWGL